MKFDNVAGISISYCCSLLCRYSHPKQGKARPIIHCEIRKQTSFWGRGWEEETPPWLGAAMEGIWLGRSPSVCVLWDNALPAVVLPHIQPSLTGSLFVGSPKWFFWLNKSRLYFTPELPLWESLCPEIYFYLVQGVLDRSSQLPNLDSVWPHCNVFWWLDLPTTWVIRDHTLRITFLRRLGDPRACHFPNVLGVRARDGKGFLIS